MSTIRRIVVVVADRFFLLRPLVMMPAVTFFLLGYGGARAGHARGDGRFWLAVIAYAILMGSVYVVNQLTDVESDRANDKLFLLPDGIIKKSEALALAVLLALFSMAAALKVGGTTPWLFGLSLGMGIAYSVPPLALKRLFPLDIVWNAVGYGVVAYATGWSVVRTPGLPDLTNALPFALCVAGVFVLTALVDREGDERSGFKSTGVALSLKQGVWLALVLVVMALVLAVLVENRLATIGSALSLPLFAGAALRGNSRSAKIAYRCSSAVFVLMVGVINPLFLAVVLVLLGLSRVYYSKRFSLGYPSVRGR
ncbi:MAG: UbiA family prenyltransferase [Candidatus Eisenbacteria bacterium]|nr:UbiA family prenyltransferase [Candidatus Eisenbacteria bacterium]